MTGLAALAGLAAAETPETELTSTRVANLLAAADAATVGGGSRSRVLLAPLLDALVRLGAHPAAGSDAVEEWRGVSGVRSEAGPAWRGRVLGPAYHRGVLAPAASFRTEQLFLAGKRAQVSVATSPRTPARMTVLGSGAEACATPVSECAWWPTFTERYTITVENKGTASIRYYVVMD
ncbi:hypothetical protein F1C10_14395 [Sphingomonas sp. NBWT7]|nr:hypothetical protein F1C10_14395 [Sphingomonas sp. NBWT7]